MSQVGDQSSGCHKNFDFLSQVGDQSLGCRKNFDFFVKYVYIFMILAISMIISTCPAMGGALGAGTEGLRHTREHKKRAQKVL